MIIKTNIQKTLPEWSNCYDLIKILKRNLPPSTPSLHLWFLEKIFVKTLVYERKICYAMPPTHLWLMRQVAVNASIILSYPSMCTNEWRPTASTLCPLSLPCKKLVAVMLKTKLERTIFREFLGYWWPFWMQHLLRYGTRVFEEERRCQTILIFDRFRLVISLQNKY